jgi:hypothetical protein
MTLHNMSKWIFNFVGCNLVVERFLELQGTNLFHLLGGTNSNLQWLANLCSQVINYLKRCKTLLTHIVHY